MFEIFVDDKLIAKTYEYSLANDYIYTTIRNYCSGIGEPNKEYTIRLFEDRQMIKEINFS